MQVYDTLSEALDGLRQEGFTRDYDLKESKLVGQQDTIELHPADFDIVAVYRFEGISDPEDEAVLYAVESKNGERGTLVDAYGAYSESVSPEMANKLRMRPGE